MAKKSAAANLATVNEIDAAIKRADDLFAKREKWETRILARSNKALYAILTEVYALFNSVAASNSYKETVKALRAKLAVRGIKVQSNTRALTVFVRYVFNCDRQRAYNYTNTLMAAIDKQVEPANLAEFVEAGNGVEECKKAFVKKPEQIANEAKLKQTIAEVEDSLSTMQAVKKIKLDSQSVKFIDGAKFAFLFARVANDNTFDILRAVPTTTVAMQNAAVKELAKDVIARQLQAESKAKENATTAATQKAVKSLTKKEAASSTLAELAA